MTGMSVFLSARLEMERLWVVLLLVLLVKMGLLRSGMGRDNGKDYFVISLFHWGGVCTDSQVIQRCYLSFLIMAFFSSILLSLWRFLCREESSLLAWAGRNKGTVFLRGAKERKEGKKEGGWMDRSR